MELQELHHKLYETLQFLDRVCKEQGLNYYLAYGTLLGAVRHRGFIPWDDDIDVWMKREDYMKLLQYLRSQNTDERFRLNEGEYKPKGDRPSEFQMRILDTHTKINRQFASTNIDAYLWIDIFALDSFPIEKKAKYLKKFKRRLLWYKIARCKNFVIDNGSLYSKFNKIIYKLHNKFGFFKWTLKEEKEIEKTYKALTRYGNEGEYYFSYAAVYLDKSEKCIFEKKWFETSTDLLFVNKEFSSPSGWHEVLTTLYKEYMVMPKEHERYNHEVKSAQE